MPKWVTQETWAHTEEFLFDAPDEKAARRMLASRKYSLRSELPGYLYLTDDQDRIEDEIVEERLHELAPARKCDLAVLARYESVRERIEKAEKELRDAHAEALRIEREVE